MADQLPFAGPLWFKQIADVVRGNDSGELNLSELFVDADGNRFQPGGDDIPPHNVSEFYGYPDVSITYEWDSTLYSCEVAAPVANFTISNTTPVFDTYIVVASTSTGTISSYSWSFSGDATPTTSTSSSVNVKWATAGTKSVTLTVTGPGGSDSKTRNVNVSAVIGEVVFGAQSTGGTATQTGIWKTEDGGISTTQVSSTDNSYRWSFGLQDNSGMWMTEHSQTLVGPTYSGGVARSFDEGDTWTVSQITNYTWVNPRGIGFADTNTGWISSYSNGGARILKTTDGGANWTSQFYSSSSSTFVGPVIVYSTTRALVGAIDGYYKTTNGSTWTKITNAQMEALYSFSKVGSVTYAGSTGSTKSIWKSTDDGDTWVKVSDVTFTPYNMSFPTVDRGYAVSGDNNRVYVTQNGGVSWVDEVLTFSGLTVYNVDYNNDSVGFASASNGQYGLYKTTDGGGYWGLVSVPSNFNGLVAKKF